MMVTPVLQDVQSYRWQQLNGMNMFQQASVSKFSIAKSLWQKLIPHQLMRSYSVASSMHHLFSDDTCMRTACGTLARKALSMI